MAPSLDTAREAAEHDSGGSTNRRPGRVQYADDVEPGVRRSRSIPARRRSIDSITAVRSMSSRQVVDPANVIPIEYRTVYAPPRVLPRKIYDCAGAMGADD
jgi:hypothetical protein